MIIKPKTKSEEEPIEQLGFDVFKNNDQEKPMDKTKVLFICCFSEFGCETIGINYCIDRVKQDFPGRYYIAVGWHGREYLYRHLVDEFWALKKDHQWLREYCRAFHHASKNLMLLERHLKNQGYVLPSSYMGQYCVGNQCSECHLFFTTEHKECPNCHSKEFQPSIFSSVVKSKRKAISVPRPSVAMMEKAKGFLGKNPVGIFARGRKCYGRNLQDDFYVRLIGMLEQMEYTPIWLGEEATTKPCPVEHVVDFSRMKESENLEMTLAIISQLRFTIQYWTASTRLATMMGVPYILFESPDQIYGAGQEGIRRQLCDSGPSKLVVAHYQDMFENNDRCLKLTKRAICELEFFDYNEICDPMSASLSSTVRFMKDAYSEKVYGLSNGSI